MKKITLILLCLALFLSSAVFPSADTAPYLKTEYDDTALTLDYSWYLPTQQAQKLLDDVKSRLKEQYSPEELALLPVSFLDDEVGIYLVFSFSGFTAAVKLGGNSGSGSLSLYADVIPAFPAGADFTDGAVLEMSVLPAAGSYPGDGALAFPSLGVGAEITLTVPPTGRIITDIPADATNPNPGCFALPLENEIKLTNPTLTGNTFCGWLSGGKAVDTVAPGTQNIEIKAVFTPKTYKINYNLTTDISFSFGRANNLANPREYTYGEETPLYDIASPVGGYNFCGWYYNGEKITAVPQGITGDIIVYALWVPDEEMGNIERAEALNNLRAESFADLDSDGLIGVTDARLTLRAAIGLESFSPEILARADVFGSGTLTVSNAREVLRMAIGLDDAADVYMEAKENRSNR